MPIFYPVPPAIVPRPNAAVLPLSTDTSFLRRSNNDQTAAIRASLVPVSIALMSPSAPQSVIGQPYPMARNLAVEMYVQTPPDSTLPQRVRFNTLLFPVTVFFLPNPATRAQVIAIAQAQDLANTPVPTRRLQTPVTIGVTPDRVPLPANSAKNAQATAINLTWQVPTVPVIRLTPSVPPDGPPIVNGHVLNDKFSIGISTGF